MFEADQYHHQFIASSRTSSSLLHLTTLHHSNACTTSPFDFYQQHQQSPTQKIIEENNSCGIVNYLESRSSTTAATQRDRLVPELVDSWSNDEILSLFRIRSSLENWFPEVTWELVSRKLAELGFTRSAVKCKEKFEEESSRYLNNINCNKGTPTPTSYMVFSELQELYEPNQVGHEGDGGGEADSRDDELVDSRINPCDINEQVLADDSKKRKRQKKKKKKKKKKFEMFKSLCEDVVNKLMTQQEEIQNKLIDDMLKRDEEKVAREEALKKQEMDRFHRELDFRAHEQVVASDRQATLINYLKIFTSSSSPPTSTTITPCDLVNYYKVQNPNPYTNPNPIPTPTPLADDLVRQNPNSASTNKKSRLSWSDDSKEDIGKRWPKEEVLALINLRCNLCDTAHHQDNIKEGGGLLKAPLWERISQGMLDLGYQRSARRCKEKWENINKYYRKTKDINKKRSIESRTCPYFQQLSTLYNKGTLVPPPSASPENLRVESSLNGSMDGVVVGEEDMVQVVPPAAAFEFEF